MGTDVGFELFDVDSMIDDYRNEILAIRQHFVSPAKMASKYTDLLFMIAPFYHAIFNRVGQFRETEHLNVSYFSLQYQLHRLGVYYPRDSPRAIQNKNMVEEAEVYNFFGSVIRKAWMPFKFQ